MKEGIRDGVKVILEPMIRDEARKIFPYRPIKDGVAESNHCGWPLYRDDEELMKKHARPCAMCTAPTLRTHLINMICPDCDGRAERAGKDPRKAIVPILITHRPLHIT